MTPLAVLLYYTGLFLKIYNRLLGEIPIGANIDNLYLVLYNRLVNLHKVAVE
jgi:hypothetical protein